MGLKSLKLAGFISIFKSVIVKTAFSNSYNFSSGSICNKLIDSFDIAIKHLLAFFRRKHSPIDAFLGKPTCVRCKGTARMYTNRRVKVLTALAQLQADLCIFDVPCSKKQFFYSKNICAFNTFVEVRRVTLLAIVFSFETFI